MLYPPQSSAPNLVVVTLALKFHAGHARILATAARIGGEYLPHPRTLESTLGIHVRLGKGRLAVMTRRHPVYQSSSWQAQTS